MSIFVGDDWYNLSNLFNEPGYAGFKPDVLEAPNGDGKVDATKRYLHVALKYDPPAWALWYLARAHFEACRIAEALKVPAEFYPKVENGTLRVLDYPAGAGSAEHTDFDLFTVHCYRSTPEDFQIDRDTITPEVHAIRKQAQAIDPHVHIGELGELVGLGPAMRHWVPERSYAQRAIVYFAMPAQEARISHFGTVREWVAERTARSRTYR